MKTKLTSLGTALLTAIVLWSASPTALAQTGWGDALSFDGVDDYVSVPLVLPDTGTIEMWYYVGPFDANRSVFDNNVNANDWEMWVYTSGSVSFRIDRNELITHRPNYTLDGPNRWYHFAVTWQRHGTQVDSALYVDGVLRSSFANQVWAAPGSTFYLAGGNSGNTKGNGQMDDVRIWSVARSLAEIQADRVQPLAGTEDGLVAYWKFDEGSGTTTADATGHGNTATLVNGPAWVTSTVPIIIGQPVLSNSSVAENQPAGTTVGTLSAVDPDNSRTFTFALVAGTGDTDNASFTITGNTLQTAATFDRETKSSYSIRVRATDQGDSAWQEMSFTITVLNSPETLVVANANDSGVGSLREAIANAATGDTITFAPGVTGPISLSTAGDNTYGPSAFAVTNAFTIEGNGITLQRDGSVSNLRLFYISPSGDLTLRNVTLSNGAARGGGGGNSPHGGGGGGAAGLGGAILNQGSIHIERSTLTGNQALGGSGAIRTTSTENYGGGGGGGLAGNGSDALLLPNRNGASGGPPNGGTGGINYPASKSGPGGVGGGGGGGAGGQPSTGGGMGGFGGGGGGGGIYTGPGGAGGFGGGGGGGGGGGSGYSGGSGGMAGFGGGNAANGSSSTSYGGNGGGGGGMGGAIFNHGGMLAMTNSTISGNTAQGGTGYQGGSGYGAGVLNLDGSVTILNCTFADNTVAAGSGGTPAKDGGAIYNLQQTGTAALSLVNTILANSTGGSDITNDAGTVTGDHNLVETSTGLPGGVVSLTSDPQLGSLANNGGLTFTHALLPGSPAIDAGDDSVCPATDQRGTVRSQDGNYDGISHCDIGAYEASPPTDIALNPSSVPENQPSGTTVGTLSATDATPSDTQTFTLVSGAGSTDNNSFTIAGATLKTVASFNYEVKNSYSIRVQATDQGGFTFAKQLPITVTDVNDPPVANLATYTRGLNMSLKILIADLRSNFTSDEDGDQRQLDAVRDGTNNATIFKDGTYIYYLPSATDPNRNTTDHFAYEISDGRGGLGTNAVQVTVVPSGGVANSITVSGGCATIKFFGIPGFQYDVQRATSVNGPWTTLTTSPLQPCADGSCTFTDTGAPEGSACYRCVQH